MYQEILKKYHISVFQNTISSMFLPPYKSLPTKKNCDSYLLPCSPLRNLFTFNPFLQNNSTHSKREYMFKV